MIAPTIEPTEVTQHQDEPPRFSHYVDKSKLTAAYVEGTVLMALCGHTFIPTRDGRKFPVCPKCKEEWEKLRDELS